MLSTIESPLNKILKERIDTILDGAYDEDISIKELRNKINTIQDFKDEIDMFIDDYVSYHQIQNKQNLTIYEREKKRKIRYFNDDTKKGIIPTFDNLYTYYWCFIEIDDIEIVLDDLIKASKCISDSWSKVYYVVDDEYYVNIPHDFEDMYYFNYKKDMYEINNDMIDRRFKGIIMECISK